jgi:hypothetical protein
VYKIAKLNKIIIKKVSHCLINNFLTFWVCKFVHFEFLNTLPNEATVLSILLFRSKKIFKKLYILLKVRELFQYDDK